MTTRHLEYEMSNLEYEMLQLCRNRQRHHRPVQNGAKGMRVVFYIACAMIVTVAGFLPSAVSAFTLDGNQLFELCAGQSPICTGYVMGIADAKDRDKQGISFCIPDGVSKTQLQDVVVNYLRKNTERRFPAPLLVGAALAEAFRCSN